MSLHGKEQFRTAKARAPHVGFACACLAVAIASFTAVTGAVDLSFLTRPSSAMATVGSVMPPASQHAHWARYERVGRVPHSGPAARLFAGTDKADRADVTARRDFGIETLLMRDDEAERRRKSMEKELASLTQGYEQVTGVKPDFDLMTRSKRSNADLFAQITGVDPQPLTAERSIDDAVPPLPRRNPYRH